MKGQHRNLETYCFWISTEGKPFHTDFHTLLKPVRSSVKYVWIIVLKGVSFVLQIKVHCSVLSSLHWKGSTVLLFLCSGVSASFVLAKFKLIVLRFFPNIILSSSDPPAMRGMTRFCPWFWISAQTAALFCPKPTLRI